MYNAQTKQKITATTLHDGEKTTSTKKSNTLNISVTGHWEPRWNESKLSMGGRTLLIMQTAHQQ